MQKTRFVMCGQENLYSLFAIDGYNNYCQLILDKNLKKFGHEKPTRQQHTPFVHPCT